MADLYGVLGIERTAPPAEIKAAYRAKAKETHPDHGGDAMAFSAVQLAYEVLSDPDRRAAYDRDGSISHNTIDEATAKALGMIQQMLEQALSNIGSDGQVFDDVVKKMHSALEESRQHLIDAMEDNLHEIGRLKKFGARFSVKDGTPNFLAQMIDAKAAERERRLPKMKEGLELHDKAAEILNDFSFQADKPQPQAFNPQAGPQAGLGFRQASGFWR